LPRVVGAACVVAGLAVVGWPRLLPGSSAMCGTPRRSSTLGPDGRLAVDARRQLAIGKLQDADAARRGRREAFIGLFGDVQLSISSDRYALGILEPLCNRRDDPAGIDAADPVIDRVRDVEVPRGVEHDRATGRDLRR